MNDKVIRIDYGKGRFTLSYDITATSSLTQARYAYYRFMESCDPSFKSKVNRVVLIKAPPTNNWPNLNGWPSEDDIEMEFDISKLKIWYKKKLKYFKSLPKCELELA